MKRALLTVIVGLMFGLAAISISMAIQEHSGEPRYRPSKPAPPPAIDWSPWRAELDACRERTEALRWTLEVLIRSWPGRAKLPEAPGGWPEWPEPGIAREWRRDGW